MQTIDNNLFLIETDECVCPKQNCFLITSDFDNLTNLST